jgi:hypothetical protein
MNSTLRKTLSATSALLVLSGPIASAAIMAINFGVDVEATPTGAYTTQNLSANATASSWTNITGDFGDTTFSADGATIKLYFDCSNLWQRGGPTTNSATHGFLDDWNYNGGGGSSGLNAGPVIMLGGLSDWLLATGSTSYEIVVLRASDNTSAAFSDIRWADINGTSPVGWFSDPVGAGNWPIVGDYAGGNAVDGDLFLGSGVAESASFGSSLNNVIIQGGHIQDSGALRGSIAGIVIVGVPEPSTAFLAGLAAIGILRRRR